MTQLEKGTKDVVAISFLYSISYLHSDFPIMASTTTVIELEPIVSANHSNRERKDQLDLFPVNNSNGSLNRRLSAANESLAHRNSFAEQVQKWNSPRINVYRLFSAFWGFILMGANDAVIGVRL